MDLITQRTDAARDFLEVAVIIAKASGVVISASEPAIIQYKKFDPELDGVFRQFFDQIVFLEIKTEAFPGVYKYRSLGHDRFRSRKRCMSLQFISKSFRRDAALNPDNAVFISGDA